MENKKQKNEIGDERKNNNVANFDSQTEYNQSYINDLAIIKRHGSTVPAYIPKKFIDQFYFYDNGATIKLYIYINNVWRETSLS